MKLVVTALLESVSGIINVLIVVLLIWYKIFILIFFDNFRIMFGIFGISLMKNKTKYCSLPDPDANIYGVGEKEVNFFYKKLNFQIFIV